MRHNLVCLSPYVFFWAFKDYIFIYLLVQSYIILIDFFNQCRDFFNQNRDFFDEYFYRDYQNISMIFFLSLLGFILGTSFYEIYFFQSLENEKVINDDFYLVNINGEDENLDNLEFSLNFDIENNSDNGGGTPPNGNNQPLVIPDNSNSPDEIPQTKRKRVSGLTNDQVVSDSALDSSNEIPQTKKKKVSSLINDKVVSTSEIPKPGLIRDIANKLLNAFESSTVDKRARLTIKKANLSQTELSDLSQHIETHNIEFKKVNLAVKIGNVNQYYLTRKIVDLLYESLDKSNDLPKESLHVKMNKIIDKLIANKNNQINCSLTNLGLTREEILLVEKHIRLNTDSKPYKLLTELSEKCNSRVWVSKDLIEELSLTFRPDNLPNKTILSQTEKRLAQCMNDVEQLKWDNDSSYPSKLTEIVKEILNGKRERKSNYSLNHVSLNKEQVDLVLDYINNNHRDLVSYKGELNTKNTWKINLHYKFLDTVIADLKTIMRNLNALDKKLLSLEKGSPILKAVRELELKKLNRF